MLWTTRVTVDRPDGDIDPYEAQSWDQVATNVDAHIGSPSGRDQHVGGGKEVVDAILHTPTTPPLAYGDRVTEPVSGQTWVVAWVQRRRGVGLDHQRAALRRVNGGA